jgi:hypothetical protein
VSRDAKQYIQRMKQRDPEEEKRAQSIRPGKLSCLGRGDKEVAEAQEVGDEKRLRRT